MDPTEAARFAAQLAATVIAAKAGGLAFRRWLKQPSVLGELAVGILIGPHMLGSWPVPGLGALFPLPTGGEALSQPFLGVGVLASCVLLFMAGLETDPHRFFRYAAAGAVTGLGGALVSFATAACIFRFPARRERSASISSSARCVMTGAGAGHLPPASTMLTLSTRSSSFASPGPTPTLR